MYVYQVQQQKKATNQSLTEICLGWQRFSFFNNEIFNIKNIYYGTLRRKPVILKKLAHQSEWIKFDACFNKASCVRQVKLTLARLLPCSNPTFISKFRHA